MWTETWDSPLKQRDADTKQWVAEMGSSIQRQSSLRQHVNRELDRQVTHKATLKLERSGENADVRRSTDADAQKMLEQQASEKEATEKKKTTMKAGLDAQVAIVNERMRDARMREAHEAAEMKMRTVKQLCDELDAQERRKKVEKKEADEAFKTMCANKEKQKAEKQREN